MTGFVPFSSCWDARTWRRARSLLARCMAAADASESQLFLDGGTLLGYIRQRTVLAWDDDLDFVLLDESRIQPLTVELGKRGLHVINGDGNPDFAGTLKIFDPEFEPITHAGMSYTFPYADVFRFDHDEGRLKARSPFWPYVFPASAYLPARKVSYLGIDCPVPNEPLRVMDKEYKDWRTKEVSSWWNHRDERENPSTAERPIETDSSGLKVEIDEHIRDCARLGLDPYWAGHRPPFRAEETAS